MQRMTAAEVAKRRMSIAARRLGARDPVEAIGGLLDRSFDLPVGDPRYGSNSLLPGSLPLEHSFDELAPGALRFVLQPLGPQASPLARQQECSREARRLVQSSFGKQALNWFDQRSEPFRTSRLSGSARYGACFGAGFDDGGLQEAKVYYEVSQHDLNDLPPNLLHASRIAMACLPGLVPTFTSIACGRAQGAQRIYFAHRGELRLLDLEPLMNRLGIGNQLPSLLTTVGLILGGRFTLPEDSVILGLRDTSRGMEMKLYILLPEVPDVPREMHGLIQMHLDSNRPEALRGLRNWVQAMTPDNYQTPGDLSVFGVRVNPTLGSRLTLYFRPVGYDAEPSRGRRDAISDPYALRA